MNDKRFNENEEREPEDAVTSRPQTVEPGALITAVPDKSLSRAIGNQAGTGRPEIAARALFTEGQRCQVLAGGGIF